MVTVGEIIGRSIKHKYIIKLKGLVGEIVGLGFSEGATAVFLGLAVVFKGGVIVSRHIIFNGSAFIAVCGNACLFGEIKEGLARKVGGNVIAIFVVNGTFNRFSLYVKSVLIGQSVFNSH